MIGGGGEGGGDIRSPLSDIQNCSKSMRWFSKHSNTTPWHSGWGGVGEPTNSSGTPEGRDQVGAEPPPHELSPNLASGVWGGGAPTTQMFGFESLSSDLKPNRNSRNHYNGYDDWALKQN